MRSTIVVTKTRTIHPLDMSAEDMTAWHTLRAGHADYATPRMSRDFARAAATDRPDARVSFIHDASGLAAILSYYRRPDGVGRPIGAPFCDYSGPLVRSDSTLTLADIVKQCGLSAWRSHSLMDVWGNLGVPDGPVQSTMVISLAGSDPETYLEARRAEHAKRFKNFRRLESQMQRDGHELAFRFGPMDDALKASLFSTKSTQYRMSGMVDLIHATRARKILDAIAASDGGFHTSLWSGDQLVSAHFGFRDGKAFHPWIAAYDPAFAHYSPGNILLKRIIMSMPEMGLDDYDLAEGHDHYKKYYTNASRHIRSANVAIGLWHRIANKIWEALGANREGHAAQRLRRRIEHAAMSESRFWSRVSDLGVALRRKHDVPHVPSEAASKGREV